MATAKTTPPRKAAKAAPRKAAKAAPPVETPVGRADKAALLEKRADTTTGFPEEEVPIPGFGTALVRGLSRHEALHIYNTNGGRPSTLVVERRTIAAGLIDPPMSEDEVERWQKVAPAGELRLLSEAIGRLSGMIDRPVKAAYLEFEDDPEKEFRALPRGSAEDDGDTSSD